MVDGAQLLTLAFAAGGAWAGVRIELRRLRRELEQMRRIVRGCPHHAEPLKHLEGTP